jgi:hypothetical protein
LRVDGEPKQSARGGETLKGRIETPQEYGQRIQADMAARPASYFAQRELARTDAQLVEYLRDAWANLRQLEYFRREHIWPRNPDACQHYGGCRFFELCTGRASIDDVRFGERPGPVHAELSAQLQADSRELLTNSRMTALRRCPRLHQYQYEMKLARLGQTDEALAFGTLMHGTLEQWFKALASGQA